METLHIAADRFRPVDTNPAYSEKIKKDVGLYNDRLQNLLDQIDNMQAQGKDIADAAIAGAMGSALKMRALRDSKIDLMVNLRGLLADKQKLEAPLSEFRATEAETALHALRSYEAQLSNKLKKAGVNDAELLSKAMRTNERLLELDRENDAAQARSRIGVFTAVDSELPDLLEGMIREALSL
jgi:hypothetical protein